MILGTFERRIGFDVLTQATIATAAFLSMLAVVDLVEIGNHLGTKEPSIRDVLILVVLGLPRLARDVFIVGAAIGSATAIGAFVRRSEMGAYFAAGAGPQRLLRAVVAAAIGLGLMHAVLIEFVIPSAAPKVRELRERLGIRRGIGIVPDEDQTWFKAGNALVHVRARIDGKGESLRGVLLLEAQDGRLLRRADTDVLSFRNGRWSGRSVRMRTFELQSMTSTVVSNAVLGLAETPADFVSKVAAPTQLRFRELTAARASRERLGRSTHEHVFEWIGRMTSPLTVILAVALAAAWALRGSRRQTLAYALTVGSGAGFCAWMCNELARALASTRALDPGWAAAMAPALMGFLSLVAWRAVARLGVASR